MKQCMQNFLGYTSTARKPRNKTKLGHGDCVETENGHEVEGGVRVHTCPKPNGPGTVVDTCGT